jgi:hypothetical protein
MATMWQSVRAVAMTPCTVPKSNLNTVMFLFDMYKSILGIPIAKGEL